MRGPDMGCFTFSDDFSPSIKQVFRDKSAVKYAD
jgi:hypothetical protein